MGKWKIKQTHDKHGKYKWSNVSNKYNVIKHLIYQITQVMEYAHVCILVNSKNQKLIILALRNFYEILLSQKVAIIFLMKVIW